MSFESNLTQYPSTETTDALRPGFFFAPPPQPDALSHELFDQEIAELDLDFSFEAIDEIFTTFRNSIPNISTPSALASSTGAVYGVTSSHCSSDFTQLDYSIFSDMESYYLLDNGPYGMHDPIHSAVSSNGPPSIPPLHQAEAQFDFGTSDLSPNSVVIPPEDLSTAMQPPPSSIVPTPLPAHVTPVSEAQTASTPDRALKCPHSPHCKAETN